MFLNITSKLNSTKDLPPYDGSLKPQLLDGTWHKGIYMHLCLFLEDHYLSAHTYYVNYGKNPKLNTTKKPKACDANDGGVHRNIRDHYNWDSLNGKLILASAQSSLDPSNPSAQKAKKSIIPLSVS